jgi:hypothetical protein
VCSGEHAKCGFATIDGAILDIFELRDIKYLLCF